MPALSHTATAINTVPLQNISPYTPLLVLRPHGISPPPLPLTLLPICVFCGDFTAWRSQLEKDAPFDFFQGGGQRHPKSPDHCHPKSCHSLPVVIRSMFPMFLRNVSSAQWLLSVSLQHSQHTQHLPHHPVFLGHIENTIISSSLNYQIHPTVSCPLSRKLRPPYPPPFFSL